MTDATTLEDNAHTGSQRSKVITVIAVLMGVLCLLGIFFFLYDYLKAPHYSNVRVDFFDRHGIHWLNNENLDRLKAMQKWGFLILDIAGVIAAIMLFMRNNFARIYFRAFSMIYIIRDIFLIVMFICIYLYELKAGHEKIGVGGVLLESMIAVMFILNAVFYIWIYRTLSSRKVQDEFGVPAS